MKRKDFLKSIAFTAASSSIFLAACGGETKTEEKPAESAAPATESTPAPTTETPAATASADCNDLSGLSEADIKQRESVQYVAKSTEADKNCSNCRFFQPGDPCGACQLFKGPVASEGYCKSWFKKDA